MIRVPANLRLQLVVAWGKADRAIGQKQGLPWGRDYPEDLRRFKWLTLGRPMISGRKTAASIGRVLPGRRNVVVSASAFENPAKVIETFGGSFGALYLHGVDPTPEGYSTTIPDAGNGLEFYSSFQAALDELSKEVTQATWISVVGGSSLFTASLPVAHVVHLSEIGGDRKFPDADVWMDPIPSSRYTKVQATTSREAPEVEYQIWSASPESELKDIPGFGVDAPSWVEK